MTTTKKLGKEFPAALPLIWLCNTAYLFWYIMPLIVGGFIDSLGFSPQLAGRIAGIQNAATMAATALAALTIHRWNLRRAALAGAILAFLSDFCAASLQSASLIILTRIISGFSMGVILCAASAGIARLKNPTRILGIVQAVIAFSSFGWFLTMPYLLKISGMKGPFVGLAAFSLTAWVLALAWFPRFEGKEDAVAGQQGLLNLFTVPILMLIVGFFIMIISFSGVWAYWERIGIHCGLSAEGIGITLAISSIGGIFGGLVAAWIAGRLGNYTALAAGIFVLLAGVVILFFNNHVSYIVSTIIIYMCGFYVLSFFLGMFAEADSSGRLVSVANITIYAGAAIGPILSSMLLIPDSYNPIIFAYCIGLIAVNVLTAFAARKKGGALEKS